MRLIARLVLLIGPGLSLPAALALWTREAFSNDLCAAGAAAAAIGLEFLLLRRRGLLREATVLALSGFWSLWAWLALTDPGYAWTALPAWRAPDSRGLMIVILATIIYLVFYEIADRPAAA
jgi:hypothetical protein